MKRCLLLFAGYLLASAVLAQTTPPVSTESTAHPKPVASNLLQAFEQGHFHGSFRTYFMATDNTRNLSDYHALAAGGGLHFSTAPFHGFSFGIGGLFNYNLASSDLSAKDSVTGSVNRYEIGLFDVENPKNRDDLDRIEELWLRYQWKKSRITVGQQSLQTPLVNYQDGRMRPTAEAGAWAEINELKNTKIEGGWLWRISPRSTVNWYNIGESIGLYPKGLNPDGTGSGYPENLESQGIGIFGITHKWGKRLKVQGWNQYVDQIFNTVFVQTDYIHPLKNEQKLLLGVQVIHQDALEHGGNADASKTYFSKGSQSNVISTQVGWQRGNWQSTAAYTRITADGRFLSPREWGREPFYTFMPRERVEGSGDSHSITGRVNWQSDNKKLRIEAAYGHFYLPDVKNPALNKYAIPSYNQLNFDVRYAFRGMFEGLKAQLLYVWKGRIGEVYNNDKFVINRVNMSHYNLIFNYTY
jgi:hypothetical protein